jgi:hypothetical protein
MNRDNHLCVERERGQYHYQNVPLHRRCFHSSMTPLRATSQHFLP